MALWGCRRLAALLLFGDALLSIPFLRWETELLQAAPAGTPAATLNVRRVPLFVAGGEPVVVSPPSSTNDAATDDALASAVARGQELLLRGSLHEAADVLNGVLASKHDEPGALLHLAEALAQLGQLRRATTLVNRLLSLRRLTPEARSFMLNRRGYYQQSAHDWTGARESFELALDECEHGQQCVNRHALWNLASLLHYHMFPSEAAGSNFHTLHRSIELYQAALGQDGSLPAARSRLPDPGGGKQGHDIGGPIDQQSILRGLAGALIIAGRPEEAVAELEHFLADTSSNSARISSSNSNNNNNSEIDESDKSNRGNQVVTANATAGAAASTKSRAFLWDSLSGAKVAAGDISGAIAAGKIGLSLVGDEPGLYHNMAVIFQRAGLLMEAQDAWRAAVALDQRFAPALTGLGHLEGQRGNVRKAREFYEASLSALKDAGKGDGVGNDGDGHSHINSGDEEISSMFLIATAVVPALYRSNDHIAQVRRDFEAGLDRLLAEPMSPASKGVLRPSTTVGSGALGYYIIYQGFEDLELRRKLARAYWKFAPSLRYCAPFLAYDSNAGESREHGPSPTEEPLDSLNGESPEEMKSSPSRGDGETILSSPPAIALERKSTSREDLFAVGAGYEPSEEHSNAHKNDDNNEAASLSCRRRRVRVGFLSAFFYHHSVGLLMEGVVTRLDRRRFETTAIFLQPHPTSASAASSPGKRLLNGESIDSMGGTVGDDVYSAVRTRTEHVLDVPGNSPAACRHAIASLQLDVLVFTEIGMDSESYFLSFARLARRSALFWGHAVTSGVSAFDALSSRHDDDGNDGQGHTTGAGKDSSGFIDSREAGDDFSGAAGGRARGLAINPHEVGGIDYFVSSWLFEDKSFGRRAQRKYSESLYLMKGLTTRFGRPAPPKPGLVTRETLGIPRQLPVSHNPQQPSGSANSAAVAESAATAAAETSRKSGELERAVPNREEQMLPLSCAALYLVPQTLYKLHPDFDRLVAGVLSLDRSGCVVFIRAVEASMTEMLAQRITESLYDAGVRAERVIFVPRVGASEFQSLVELADVVLDPFPVGGGRSSLEIFAVGTPIVMLYNRTSILQLTYGMYATMGLEGALGNDAGSNALVSLVTFSEGEFIRSAVAIATDVELNTRSRELILANNHRLYEQDAVVAEWEEFLEGIVSAPRPSPTERNYSLAVDSSNFPKNIPWCSVAPPNGDNNEENEDGYVSLPYRRSNAVAGDVSPPYRIGDAVPLQATRLDAPAVRSLLEEAGSPRLSAARGRFTERNGDVSEGLPDGSEETSESRSATVTTEFQGHSAPSEEAGLGILGVGVGPENVNAAAATRRAEMLKEPPRGATPALERVSEDHHRPGDASLAGESGALVKDGPKLLYAIEFSVAPPRVGGEVVHLSAQVYEGGDPMEEADRLKEEGALDHLQHKWVAAILCRGVGRLKRPVVWSTFVKIDGGPRMLLEVRQGDELYQVARWHCLRYSLGAERVPVLSNRLEKELPQHGDPEWVFSRVEDRSCSMPVSAPSSASSVIADHKTGHSILLGSDMFTPRGDTLSATSSTVAAPAAAAASAETSEELRGEKQRGSDGFNGGLGDDGDSGIPHFDWGNEGYEEDDDQGGGCVTLAITTCKRLRAFLGTAEGLQVLLGPLPQNVADGGDVPRVCQVLVVDDGSSPKDRGLMMSSFPRFTYVFKGPGDVKGHAGSMNLILSLTTTRYLLYVEDDWWAVHDYSLPPRSGVRNFLWRAMEVLKSSTERVSQVIINDQSTRNCAWGDTATCTSDIQGTMSGWPRTTAPAVSTPGQEHRYKGSADPMETAGDDAAGRSGMHYLNEGLCATSKGPEGDGGVCGSDRNVTRRSRSGRDTAFGGSTPVSSDRGGGGTAVVEYRLHEFGLLSPLQGFSHWPGFSLNPALWDLARLGGSYRQQYSRKFEFNPADDRFEQRISMELWGAGIAVAHLPDVTFRHVGAGQSAYEANAMRRPWD